MHIHTQTTMIIHVVMCGRVLLNTRYTKILNSSHTHMLSKGRAIARAYRICSTPYIPTLRYNALHTVNQIQSHARHGIGSRVGCRLMSAAPNAHIATDKEHTGISQDTVEATHLRSNGKTDKNEAVDAETVTSSGKKAKRKNKAWAVVHNEVTVENRNAQLWVAGLKKSQSASGTIDR
ncbi:hypothetical protein SARC_09471 [Sphaeroforma arctica JP610]|uniref:Uncharacterized protein n=1 Tax=Sphaeroforma arctica JP610 TaxID=667725 RepID=A0A0L0FMV1_9EUKA|nr:hypothetical protein SARC_09471 [Sphaeroforma arctica JP610]KNC78085.1 hypothetical protein SARC_09471 [Sphaeroforma arctica JP610]|eukprot:XP_014151987.1 hypothetical protein SARC_09471 [Sphaeroforma arctica JP610]